MIEVSLFGGQDFTSTVQLHSLTLLLRLFDRHELEALTGEFFVRQAAQRLLQGPVGTTTDRPNGWGSRSGS
ncbi:MAG: hypothetical protein ACYC3X_26210 [Pirellulaceae bacterium]